MVGLSISLDGKVATVTEDQVLKVFDIRDLSSKSFPSQRTSLARVPVDVAFAKSGEVFVLAEVRHVTLSNLPIPIASRLLIMPKKEGSFCKKQFHFIHRLSCEAICMVRDLCFTSQGPLGNAILELFNLETSKLSQEWEIADVHGKEAGKGILAGVTPFGLSVALTYSGQTDLQVFTARAKPLASINSSGRLGQARSCRCPDPVKNARPATASPILSGLFSRYCLNISSGWLSFQLQHHMQACRIMVQLCPDREDSLALQPSLQM